MRSNQSPNIATLMKMSTPPTSPGISQDEYARRKQFLDDLKSLTKSECVEIVRILHKHDVAYSENLNGIFFNVSSLSQQTFDDMVTFIEFSKNNRRILSDRDCLMSTLVVHASVCNEPDV